VLNFLRGDEEAAICWSSFALQFTHEPEQVYRHARLLMALDRISEVFTLFREHQVKPTGDPRFGVLLAQAYTEVGKKEEALALVLMLDRRKDLPPSLGLEFALLKVLLFEHPKEILPEQEEEFLEKKEALFSVLDDDPREQQIAVYWPTGITEQLTSLFEEREAKKEAEGESKFWFTPSL
jgi:hypothetical protein